MHVRTLLYQVSQAHEHLPEPVKRCVLGSRDPPRGRRDLSHKTLMEISLETVSIRAPGTVDSGIET